ALHQETGSSSLSVGPFTLDSSSAEFELILSLVESEQGVTGVWEYNTDLFDRTTIERMVDHYLRLLEAVVRNPRERISQLPMLSEAELQKLLPACEYQDACY